MVTAKLQIEKIQRKFGFLVVNELATGVTLGTAFVGMHIEGSFQRAVLLL